MIKLKRSEGNISFQKKNKIKTQKKGKQFGVFPNYRVQMARRVQSAARACPLMSAEGEASIEQSMKMPSCPQSLLARVARLQRTKSRHAP